MSTRSILFSLLLFILPINAMKRSHDQMVKTNNPNNCMFVITDIKLLMDVPIKFYPFKQLIKYPTLNINQQNRHGETALLRCLLLRKKHRIAPIFVSSIKELLDAGADPELADNYGITPLMAAQQLQDKAESNNERIIDLIKQAIERKYSTS